jgi:hypothetical protein
VREIGFETTLYSAISGDTLNRFYKNILLELNGVENFIEKGRAAGLVLIESKNVIFL